MVLFALVGLLALGAIGTSTVAGAEGAEGAAGMLLVPRLPGTAVDLLLILLLVLISASGAVSFVYLQARLQKEAQRDQELQRFRLPRSVLLVVTAPVAVVLAFVVLMSLLAGGRQTAPSFAQRMSERQAEVAEQAERGELQTVAQLQARARWQQAYPLILGATVVVLFVLVAIFGARLMREEASVLTEEGRITAELKQALAGAIELAIDDIATEASHRRAVELCYARMEAVLEAHGLVRPLHQTPLEYMHAVLSAGPGLPEQELLGLTGLYELAKFSTHPIGETQRGQALTGLQQIHADLVQDLATTSQQATPA